MKPQDLWARFNLRDTPYFQEALQLGSDARYSVEGFVARYGEARRLARTILGHAGSSRQTIRGTVGVGKSTLAQYVKALLVAERFYSNPDAVALGHADGADEVSIRILSYVYETLSAVAQAKDKLTTFERSAAAQNTRQMVRVFRETTGLAGGVNVSFLGGVLAGRSTSLNTPNAARPGILIGELLQGLMRTAREELGARGVIVHVDNLENLSDRDARRAGAVFRDLRDPCLLADGYHWLVVGTSDALTSVIDAHPQLRTVFSLTLALEPLKLSELLRLLERRYKALAVDDRTLARAPVAPTAVQALYSLFYGDMRAILAALDEAAHGLLGYGTRPSVALSLGDIQPFLRRRYEADASARLSAVQLSLLQVLARRLKARSFIVKDAAAIWENERSRAARLLAELLRAGYVFPLEQRLLPEDAGRPATLFRLSGAALLAFAAE